MRITPVKTKPVVVGDKLFSILDEALPEIRERSIVVVTSKIVSICEGRVVKIDNSISKAGLAEKEAEKYFVDPVFLELYKGIVTINEGNLIFNAGIDESNGNESFILWPTDRLSSARKIWEHLKKRDNLKNFGVIISDSHLIPLRWGTRGFGLAWCGFLPLNNYIGKPDIFGKPLKHTQLSVLDGLAAAAVTIMGEGNEQTPLAVIEDIPFVQFQNRPPIQEEIAGMKISLEEDVYAPLLTSVKWKTRRGDKT